MSHYYVNWSGGLDSTYLNEYIDEMLKDII